MEERTTQTEPMESGGKVRILAPLGVIGLIAVSLAAFYAYRHVTAVVPAPPPIRDLAKEAKEDLDRRNFRPLSAPLAALLADAKYEPIPTQAHKLLLQAAPDFTLPDVTGKEFSLAKELNDGPVVLVFYYGYHCNHCVSQLFALDKDLAKFRELGVRVVAISADPAELTRERFKQYGAFGFPVLADRGNKIAEKYETFVASAKPGQEGEPARQSHLDEPRRRAFHGEPHAASRNRACRRPPAREGIARHAHADANSRSIL